MERVIVSVVYPTTAAELVMLILVFFGCTFLIKDSTILGNAREWVRKVDFFDRLLSCSFCVGTWVGLVIGACRVIDLASTPQLGNVVSPFVCAETIVFYAMLSATSAYILDLITQALEVYIHGRA